MPSNTEPYEQLISQEEAELANRLRKQRERHNKQRYSRSDKKSSKNWPESPPCDYAPEFPDPSHGAPFVKRFIEFLLSTSDPWRLAIGCAVIFMMLNTGASRGWISIPGLPPLAEAASVTEVRSDQLDGQIESTVREHCSANTSKAKTYYWSKLNDLSDKFQKATKKQAKIPTCKDLGVLEVVVNEP